jgi:hypothetical protein
MSKFRYSTVWKEQLLKFQSDNKHALLSDIKKSFESNGITFIYEEVSKAIDRQSKALEKKQRLTLSEVYGGAKALVKYLAGKSVSPAEIQRRVAICSGSGDPCPMLTEASGCASCGMAGKATLVANGIRAHKNAQIKIPSEVHRKYCDFCKCSIPLIVVTPLDEFHKEGDAKNSTRPDRCWLKATSPNFTQE